MTIQHTCPSDVIQAMQICIDEQQALIDRLRAALRECHQHMAHGQTDPDFTFENRTFRELFGEEQQ